MKHCVMWWTLCIILYSYTAASVQSSPVQSVWNVCLSVCLSDKQTCLEHHHHNNHNNNHNNHNSSRAEQQQQHQQFLHYMPNMEKGRPCLVVSLSLSVYLPCISFHLYNCTYTLHLYLSTSSVKTTQFHHSFAGSLSDHSPFTIHHSPFTRQTTQLHFNI